MISWRLWVGHTIPHSSTAVVVAVCPRTVRPMYYCILASGGWLAPPSKRLFFVLTFFTTAPPHSGCTVIPFACLVLLLSRDRRSCGSNNGHTMDAHSHSHSHSCTGSCSSSFVHCSQTLFTKLVLLFFSAWLVCKHSSSDRRGP